MNDDENQKVERLDQYVIRRLPKLSRSAAVHLVEAGKVSVNGKIATKAGYRVKQQDNIDIDVAEADAAVVPEIELEIVYEDKACVAINKPAGVLVHSKGVFNPEATVATWLSSRAKGMDGERAGIVHRLDRATSGIMICAKTPEALSWLQKQFSERKVKKIYRAVVSGTPAKAQAIIDMPIERNPKKPQTFRVGANGKAAVTEYKMLASNEKYSLQELRPTTGRTHQLRVHLQHLGHPILGDTMYGGAVAERLFLHAESLEITLPNKTRKVLEVPVPGIFKEKVS